MQCAEVGLVFPNAGPRPYEVQLFFSSSKLSFRPHRQMNSARTVVACEQKACAGRPLGSKGSCPCVQFGIREPNAASPGG